MDLQVFNYTTRPLYATVWTSDSRLTLLPDGSLYENIEKGWKK
jgi:hypothetical protein